MTLACPECGKTFSSTKELKQICNICGCQVERNTSQIFHPEQGQTVLVCKHCLPQLNYYSLTEILETR